MRTHKKVLVLILCVLNLPQAALTQNVEMEAGIADFNRRDYTSALGHFRTAESNGLESDALIYNLAVTLYRLERYDEARNYFSQLEDDPQWLPLLHYNYGLIAEIENDLNTARAYFSQARDQVLHAKISTSAEVKLARLNEAVFATSAPELSTPPVAQDLDTLASGPTAGRDNLWLARFSLGSDSNAASLADDFVQSRSLSEDVYSELLVYGQQYLTGQSGDGWRGYGLLFNRGFSEFNNLNALVYGAGAVWEKPWSGISTQTGVRLTQSRLSLDKVADQLQLQLAGSRQTGLGMLESSYSFSVYSAGSDYEQVQGIQHRVDMEWSRRFTQLRLSLRYRFEENDRDDLSRNGAFSSYSPTRNGILASVNWPINNQLEAGVFYEFIDSRYAGINRLRDSNGQVVTQKRERNSNQISLEINYHLDSNWQFNAQMEHFEVDDVFNIYTFDRNRFMSTVQYQF